MMNDVQDSRGIRLRRAIVLVSCLLPAMAGAVDQYALQFQGPLGRDIRVERPDISFADVVVGGEGDEIRLSAGDFGSYGFAAGHIVRVEGSSSNDGLFTVREVDGARLELDLTNQLTDENASGAMVTVSVAWAPRVQVPAVMPDQARPAVRATAQLDIPVSGTSADQRRLVTVTDLLFVDGGVIDPDRVQSVGSDFRGLGFREGSVFAVRGSASNDGLYTVAAVRESERGSDLYNVMVLAAEAELTDEGSAAVPSTAVLVTSAPGFCAEAWVRFEDYDEGMFPPKWEAVITKGRAWALSRFSNTQRVTFSTWTGSGYHDVVSASDLTPRRWHHVAAVYDGQKKYLYLDGDLEASSAWSGPLVCSEEPVLLGNAPVIPGDSRLKEGRALNGSLDNARLWAVRRTQEELQAVMQRRLRGSETGLLAAWRFDEVPGGPQALSALDSSRHAFHGQLLDLDPATCRIQGSDTSLTPPEPLSVILGAALAGSHCLLLNGVDQYVEVQNEVIFDVDRAFAMEIWIDLDRLPPAGTESALMSKGATGYEMTVDDDGFLVFRTAGPSVHVLHSAAPLATGSWHHVAALFDNGVKTLMVDGAIVAQEYGAPGPGLTDLPLCFGARPTAAKGVEAFLAGSIDEVRFWASARSPERIAQSMKRTLTGHEPGLAGWWPLDEGDGPVAADMKTIIEATDTLVTLQFEQLAYDGNEINRYPSYGYVEDSTDASIDPDGAADDVFQLANSLAADDTFAVKGEEMPDYPGSTVLFNTVSDADTILTMTGGQPFRILSIDLADLYTNCDPGTLVTFRAPVAGSLLQRTFELPGGTTVPATYTFSRFNAITELRWAQRPGYHLFDNIVLQPVSFLAPWHLNADGILVGLPDYARLDSPLQFGDPVEAQYALHFDGDSDWLEVLVPDDAPHGPTPFGMHDGDGDPLPFTLECWVRPTGPFAAGGPDNAAPFETIIRQGDTGWGLALDATGHLRYWVADDPEASFASDRPLVSGMWQHVALQVEPARNTIAFFVNGAPAGDHEAAVISVDSVNPGLAVARRGVLTGAGWFAGDIDEVRLWDYARDDAELYAFANRPLPDGMSGLIAYWRFDDGLGSTAEDASGNGYVAYLRGLAKTPDLPEWIYGPDAPNRDGMWALEFDGIDDYLEIADSLGFNPDADTIRSLSSAFATDAPPTGDDFAVAGTTSNNGDLIAEIVRNDLITVRPADDTADPFNALADEGSEGTPADGLFTWNDLRRDALLFKDSDPDRIESLSGSFTPLSVQPGDWLRVSGSTSNDGRYQVADVDPMVLVLVPSASLVTEGSMADLAEATLSKAREFDDLIFEDNSGAAAQLTLEAWLRPEAADEIDDGDVERRRTILMKEDSPGTDAADRESWGLAVDADGFPVLLLQGAPVARAVSEAARFDDGLWQHVAVTVDEDANRVVFYRNGVEAGTFFPAVTIGAPRGSLFIGRQGLGTGDSPARHHYRGYLDEVRIWTVVRTASEIEQTAMRQLFHRAPGLVAYWNFNRFDPAALDEYDPQVNFLDVVDESGNGNTASLGTGVMSVRAYVPGLYDLHWDGDYWDTDDGGGSLDLSRSTSSRGLWVGNVVLNAVNEVQTASATGPGRITPTADTFSFTVCLHVDTTGRVRLLKDVIILLAEGASTEEPLPEAEGLNSTPLTPIGQEADLTADAHVALITDDRRLAAITPAGDVRPQRISAPAYDFAGTELALTGGVGPGRGVSGTILLPRLHPTNPFRHKYHPDHRNVNPDDPDDGIEIRRELTLAFDSTEDGLAEQAGYGVQRLSGTYEERIFGLHKETLVVRGIVDLQRISTVGRLNE